MKNKDRSRRMAGGLLLVAGALLAALGLAQGQYAQVLAKAVKICLECVGIG